MITRVFFLFFLVSSILFAQVPQGINYQAVVRDADGNLYEDAEITVFFKFIILENGNLCWEESHQVQTNNFGLFTTVIGQGESTSSGSYESFSDINWTEGTMYITVDIDFDNEGPQPPIDFGETQLLSVPYSLFSDSSGDKQWIDENNIISIINEDAKIHITSSSEINLNSDNIDIGSANTSLNFNFNQINFLTEESVFIQIDSEILDVQGRIKSFSPIEPEHVTTKNYVDLQDDDIIWQMNTAFEENINYFQNQIDNISIDVDNLEENVNENSEAYYTLQDVLYFNDESLQGQIDLINTVIQTLELNINTNLELQNQLEEIEEQVSDLSDLIQQIQESISQE